MPIIVLVGLQEGLTTEQIHTEDTKVLEAALVGYWTQGKPESKTIYIPDLTSGPVRPDYDRIIDGRSEKKPIVVPKALRMSYLARNAYPIALSWFHPLDQNLRLVPQDDWKQHGTRNFGPDHRFELRQYSWIVLPGYDEDRTHALVCFAFNWSIHSGNVTVLLAKTDGVWKVTEIRDVHYV